MRALLSLSFGVLLMGAAVVRRSGPSAGGEKPFPGRFTDGTAALGVHFNRSEEHTSELQSRLHLVCRLLLEKKKTTCLGSSMETVTDISADQSCEDVLD